MSIHEGAGRDSAAGSSTIMDGLLREVTKRGRGDGGGTGEEETRGGGGGAAGSVSVNDSSIKIVVNKLIHF